jgi:hypothetical protein
MENYEQCGQGRSYCSLCTLDTIHNVYMCMYMYVYVCMYMYVYVCMYMCVCICVFGRYRFCLCLRFFNCILEMFRHRGIFFVSHFIQVSPSLC